MTRLSRDNRYIFDRDGWQCKMPVCLCPDGRALDRRLLGRDDPWAPSVDHIVPRALGGTNSARNKRAAHKRCNGAAAPSSQQVRDHGVLLTHGFFGDQGSAWS